jgi:hypothetical protein
MMILPKKDEAPVLVFPAPGPLMFAASGKQVSTIWRFYTDLKHRWRWQHLSVHREAISESAKSYRKYEDCLADAKDNGHVFQPSQAKIALAAPNPFYAK